MAVKSTKYIFVVGGVLSGLGKGITAASIGNLLKARGLKVNLQKCDPYLNVDAGLLNPREHGECFVTKDGAETDLDLGHYERFIDEELTQSSSLMSGKVLQKVIEDERKGKFAGQTVQYIPHVTKAFQQYILDASDGFDVHIVEIGGTVGDYEGLAFIEAIRELGYRVGRENCCYVHVVYLPYLGASQEIKTKPAQNAVRELRGFGIVPDILVARSEIKPPKSAVSKLSMLSGVAEDAIALLPNAKSIYEVPLTLENEGIGNVICTKLGLTTRKPNLTAWQDVVDRSRTNFHKAVKIGLIAKYLDNADTYMCVIEALKSASWWNNVNLELKWIDAEALLTDIDILKTVDGFTVPGGFGERGFEGLVLSASYAMKNSVPYLGLCLGLQSAVVAMARDSGLRDVNSTEFKPTAKNPVINTIEGQQGKENTGGTMRLGNYDCHLEKGSLAAKLYKSIDIVERHRHRYECDSRYVDKYEEWGIKAVGRNPKTGLVEVIEAINHPFFLASQYHPEFKSRPNRPHPMFDGFIKAVVKQS